MLAQIGCLLCPQIAEERWILTGIMMDSGEDQSPHQFGEFSCAVPQLLRDFFPDAVYEKISRRQADPESDLARVSLTRVLSPIAKELSSASHAETGSFAKKAEYSTALHPLFS